MKRLLAGVAVGAAVAIVVWWNTPYRTGQVHTGISTPEPVENKKPLAAATAAVSSEADPPEPAADETSQPPSPVLPKPKPVSLAAREEPPTPLDGPEATALLPPATALENMRTTIRQYSQRFGGNPVGDNAEITAALRGKNPKQVDFLSSEDGVRINAKGQLLDNWDTPYFFHQISGTEMEIHSAGPDRRMWTADDLVIK